MQHGLRTATLRRIGPRRMQGILLHIEIKRAQIDDAEVVQRMEHNVVLVVVIGPSHSLNGRFCSRCSIRQSSSCISAYGKQSAVESKSRQVTQ